MWTGYNKEIVKDICKASDSEITRKTYGFIECMNYRCGDKAMCEIFDNKGFYFATRAKNHIRLIEIAVRTEYQGQGLGRKVLNRLLTRAKALGITKITLRTPINEKAAEFWLHIGAKIVGLKDNDYEMELNIE